MPPRWPWRPRRPAAPPRSRAAVEADLSEARGELVRTWPTEQPSFSLNHAPSGAARAALQRVIRLQSELDAIAELEREREQGS
ncbi:MAG: hypothetical protein FJZ92_00760 [Chloroflexi bacterium]|nr:hypothetical protein [Chloroflexota bacterium]